MPVEGASRIEKMRTIVFLAMCALIVVFAAPVRPGIVLGESMAPAFHSGQVFLTSRVTGPESVRKGDVVLLAVDDQVFLKRVFALRRNRLAAGRRPAWAAGTAGGAARRGRPAAQAGLALR
jgi:signal peptidase I